MGQLLDPTPSDQPFVVGLAQLAQASKMGQSVDERFRNAHSARALDRWRLRLAPVAGRFRECRLLVAPGGGYRGFKFLIRDFGLFLPARGLRVTDAEFFQRLGGICGFWPSHRASARSIPAS